MMSQVQALSGEPEKEVTFVYQKLLLFLSKPQAWHIIAARSVHHVPLAEHIIEKRKRPHIRGLFFFLAPRTGLEPVTSPTVSDCQACANKARATRHRCFDRQKVHFSEIFGYAECEIIFF